MSVKKNKTRKTKKIGGGKNNSFTSIQSLNSFDSIKSMESLKERISNSKENKPNASQGSRDSQYKKGRASPSSVVADLSKNGIQNSNHPIQTQKSTSRPRKNRTLKIVHNSSNAIKDGVKIIQGEGNKYVQLYNGNVIPNGKTSSLF